MLADYIMATGFMVSVVYVPILAHFSLFSMPGRTVSAIFSLSDIFFSSP